MPDPFKLVVLFLLLGGTYSATVRRFNTNQQGKSIEKKSFGNLLENIKRNKDTADIWNVAHKRFMDSVFGTGDDSGVWKKRKSDQSAPPQLGSGWMKKKSQTDSLEKRNGDSTSTADIEKSTEKIAHIKRKIDTKGSPFLKRLADTAKVPRASISHPSTNFKKSAKNKKFGRAFPSKRNEGDDDMKGGGGGWRRAFPRSVKYPRFFDAVGLSQTETQQYNNGDSFGSQGWDDPYFNDDDEYYDDEEYYEDDEYYDDDDQYYD